MVYVRFKLLPSTEDILIARDVGTVRPDTSEPGVSEQIAQVIKFRSLMQEEYPILTLFNFSIAISGACTWILLYDPDQDRALYEAWRHSAWTIWDRTAAIVAQTDLETEDYAVRPLPGPWRFAFL